LAYLQFFGYYLKKTHYRGEPGADQEEFGDPVAFDIFNKIARAEWDTLLFFYGVVLCVGGLGFIGYLAMASELMYVDLGATNANIAVGMLSAVVDNIPVMFAVLTMMPDMSMGQWLLVTFTAGVGGSLLSVGSAAGVALMGQARGMYTFFGHLKWTPVIALGYAASIATHLWINRGAF
jgi:Na+/H+ antiporter NhaD/arsenite permease-like protein